jgi:hypothetical protein
MGLESFNFIDSLNASNPVGASDQVAQGDDHIRGLKTVLLNSFPSITAAVTLTAAEINDAANLSSGNTFTANQTLDDVSLIIEGGANNVTLSHDGTDLTIAGTGTTDINISGITALAAGTVDADFDAITATSYGGITEANLVDKSATESISGTWTFTTLVGGTFTATTIGGIAQANLVDKSATETISGTWDFTNIDVNGTLTVDTIATDAASLDFGSVSITSDNDSADEPGYKGCPINTENGNYTLALSDAGGIVRKSSGASGETITIPANSATAFPVGTVIVIINDGGGTLSIAITTDTLEQYVTGSTGTRTLADNGKAVLEKVATTTWKISGLGLS